MRLPIQRLLHLATGLPRFVEALLQIDHALGQRHDLILKPRHFGFGTPPRQTVVVPRGLSESRFNEFLDVAINFFHHPGQI